MCLEVMQGIGQLTVDDVTEASAGHFFWFPFVVRISLTLHMGDYH